MSITKLDFAAPFFDVEYIEDEKSVNVGSKSIVINIAPKGDAINISMGTRLSPMRSAIVVNTSLYNIDRALIVKDYTRYDISNPLTREQTKRHWLSLWEFSHLERDRTVPYWKTPQAKVGGDTTMNFCFASEGTPSAMHKNHPVPFDETHLQIAGLGKVQMFSENDESTLYQEYMLCPGATHDGICSAAGEYPWHRYCSITNAVFVVIEIQKS